MRRGPCAEAFSDLQESFVSIIVTNTTYYIFLLLFDFFVTSCFCSRLGIFEGHGWRDLGSRFRATFAYEGNSFASIAESHVWRAVMCFACSFPYHALPLTLMYRYFDACSLLMTNIHLLHLMIVILLCLIFFYLLHLVHVDST